MQPTNTYYGGGTGMGDYQSPKKRSNRRLILLAGGGLLVILTAVLGILSVSGGGSQQGLSDEFVQKFVASDATGTYELFTPESKLKETPESWQTKVNLTKDFFTEYKAGEVVIEDGSTADQNNQADETIETYTYVARGKDGTYAFTIVVSKDKSNKGVVSFDSSPYIDIKKVLQ